MTETLYGILDEQARAWWYHAKLRREGKATEARKRERDSIRGNVRSLRQAIEHGGHLEIGEAGWVLFIDGILHYHRGYYARNAIPRCCPLLGIPVVDHRQIA